MQEISEIDSAVVDSGTALAYLEQYQNGNISQSSVAMNNQNSTNGTSVTVTSVFVPQDGYVAIHDTSGAVIGVSEYLEPGFYNNMGITLFEGVPGKDFPADTTLPGDQSLLAMPHEETSNPDANPDEPEYDFITSGGDEDIPYFVKNNPDNGPVTDSGFITVASSAMGPGPMTNVNGNPNTSWASLPLGFFVDTDGNDEVDAEVNVDYTHNYSQVTVLFTAMDQSALDQLDGKFNVKVVIVPPEAQGSGSSSSQSSSNVEYDFSTYEEAAKHFGLTGARGHHHAVRSESD